MVAFVVLQLKVADWPLEIDVGDTLNVAVGGTGPAAVVSEVVNTSYGPAPSVQISPI